MALRTWDFKIRGTDHTISIKAAKADAEKLAHEIAKFVEVREWTHNLAGIKGKDEYSSLSTMFGFGTKYETKLADEGAYELDKLTYFAELPNPITDVAAEMKKVHDLFMKHVPVKDERTTEVEKAAIDENRQKLHQQQEEKQQQETNAWLDKHGVSHEKIPIPEGMMAIYAQHTFDDSDAMSDYYHPHASIGEPLLLAIVSKQAETERLARQAVSRYPDLTTHTYEWHTEKYSMGHGNYLTSEYFEKEQVWKGEVRVRLEIEFSAGGGYRKEMHPYPGYPGNAPAAADSPPTGNGKATMRLNAEHEGVEVKFAERPEDEVISTLKSSGFRWSKRQHLWYAKQSPATIAVAQQITGAAA